MSNSSDFEIENGILKEYIGEGGEVVIPEYVTKIGAYAFSRKYKVKKVVFNDSLQEIDRYAFEHCSFDMIKLPAGLLKIGRGAFEYCVNIKEIVIPPRIEKIDLMDFYCVQRIICYNKTKMINSFEKSSIKDTYGFCRTDQEVVVLDSSAEEIISKLHIPYRSASGPKTENITKAFGETKDGIDYKMYDDAFVFLKKLEIKYKIALDRLNYSFNLSENTKEMYLEYINANFMKYVKLLIDRNDFPAVYELEKYGLYTKQNIDSIVKCVIEKNDMEMVSYFLNLQNKVKREEKHQDKQSDYKTKIPKKKKSEEDKLWQAPTKGMTEVGRYLGVDTDVVFPETIAGVTVTGIANTTKKTPENYSKIKSITIPEGYVRIGKRAFAGCTSLEILNLPKTLKEIDTEAFANCKKLKEVNIPEGVTFLGEDVFSKCNIERIVLEAKKIELKKHAFFSCPLKELIFKGNLLKGRQRCFGDEIPWIYTDGKIEIYDVTEYHVKLLSMIGNPQPKIEKTLSQIKQEWKYSVLENGTISLDSYLGLDSVVEVPATIGETAVTQINECAFACEIDHFYSPNVSAAVRVARENIKEIIVPNGIISIGKGAFKACRKLETVSLPETVATIGESCFEWCGQLKNIQIPDKITTIKERTFYECSSLKNIHIPEKCRKIAQEAFAYCRGLEEISVPESVEEIDRSAFFKCKKLNKVNLNENVVLGTEAFAGCDNLADAEGFVSVNNILFTYTQKNSDITIPHNIKRISKGAFGKAVFVKSLYIPANIEVIEEISWYGCSSLICGFPELEEISVDVGNSTYTSTDNCLIENESNTLILGCKNSKIPKGIPKISRGAFAACLTLKEVFIPESVIEIETGAFTKTDMLTIYAPAGSYAETYAKENNISFVTE